jgi:type VI secretion system protein ImpC
MASMDDDLLLDLIPSRLDRLLSAIDARIAAQLDEIVHHPLFQQMERAWRGLRFLVDRTDFAKNIRIALLPCTKEELRADLAHPAGVEAGALYGVVYMAELGRVGGEPYGAILADFEVAATPADLLLLARAARVAEAALAPFIVAVGPRFFGLRDMRQLLRLDDLGALFQRPEYLAWRELRETWPARYLGLVLPRFLLRPPYDGGARLAYREEVGDSEEALCWGNAVYAFGSRLADSFARYRWCPNIIGHLGGGDVDGLSLVRYQAGGEVRTRAPTEIVLTDRREHELGEEGLIGLSFREEWDQACFLSACSAQKTKYFGDSEEGRAAEMNFRLGTQLPYVLIVTRVMHYLKMMYRSHFATWGSRAEAEQELNDWVGQLVADRYVVTSAVRGRRPLRKARILVVEPADQEAWYRLEFQVRPHFKYLGAFFTLSIASRLERGR